MHSILATQQGEKKKRLLAFRGPFTERCNLVIHSRNWRLNKEDSGEKGHFLYKELVCFRFLYQQLAMERDSRLCLKGRKLVISFRWQQLNKERRFSEARGKFIIHFHNQQLNMERLRQKTLLKSRPLRWKGQRSHCPSSLAKWAPETA